MVVYFPKIGIYLGEITRYTIVAWIFANENKCHTLGRFVVKGWYTLVMGYYKYIVMSIMQWHHYVGYHRKRRRALG